MTDAYGGAFGPSSRRATSTAPSSCLRRVTVFVDSITDAGHFDAEQELRAVLHATALAAFGNVEQQYPDQVSQYPYGVKSIPFDDSLGFEDWMALYDESVTRGGAATESTQKRTQHLTAVYRDALSTAVQGSNLTRPIRTTASRRTGCMGRPSRATGTSGTCLAIWPNLTPV
ncbi:hypothetical protein [Haloarcula sp. CBA1127]|uniref:hypothetical protein n=1 Tax=Haloarcula sp. CBA1127 TaxID=1765055 RepID=UPI000A63A4DA|nr:hypothetical protein [Haloarcula sp. CBA1127]